MMSSYERSVHEPRKDTAAFRDRRKFVAGIGVVAATAAFGFDLNLSKAFAQRGACAVKALRIS